MSRVDNSVKLTMTYVDDKTLTRYCRTERLNGIMLGASAGIAIYKLVKKIKERKEDKKLNR